MAPVITPTVVEATPNECALDAPLTLRVAFTTDEDIAAGRWEVRCVAGCCCGGAGGGDGGDDSSGVLRLGAVRATAWNRGSSGAVRVPLLSRGASRARGSQRVLDPHAPSSAARM